MRSNHSAAVLYAYCCIPFHLFLHFYSYKYYLSRVIGRIKRYEPRNDESCDYCGQREGESIEIKRLFILEDVHHFVCEQTKPPGKGLEMSSDVLLPPSISQQNGDPS